VLHQELVNLALSIHGSVLLASIVAYYKYGDRTELLERALRGTDSTLSEMRRRIATELVELIDSYFEASTSAPTITPDAEPAYIERRTNPVRSEAFRDTIREFVEGHATVVAHYRLLLLTRISWCKWAQFLSWTLLALITLEVLVVGALGYLDKLTQHPLPDVLIQWSWLPMGLLIGLALVALPAMLYKHDAMMALKLQYEAF
jgi:hypothetical protein